jgi:hypothetical protein
MIDCGIPGQIRPTDGDFRLEICPNNKRDAPTLEHLIQKHVEPGSKIHTDEWKSYSRLERLGYEHYVVNHTNNFVDPVTGTHTQTIEANWRPLKASILASKSIPKEYLADHFCEYLWRRNVKKNRGGHYFESLIEDIGQLGLEWGPPDQA